jgi:hypothetical protein
MEELRNVQKFDRETSLKFVSLEVCGSLRAILK